MADLRSFVQTEDVAHGTGDRGIMSLLVRNDTLASLVSLDGDYSPGQVNAAGALYVDISDQPLAAGTNNIGDVDVLSLPAIPAGSNTIGEVTIGAATTAAADLAKAESAVHASGDVGILALAVRDDTPVGLAADGEYIPFTVDALGRLHTTDPNSGSGSPTNPVNNYQTSASLAAGSEVDLDTPEAAAKKLRSVEVWASVAFRARIFTVDNAVESTDPLAVGGGSAHEPYQFVSPHRDYITLGTTAGLDAFRIEVVNLDDNDAADVYATFHYED